MGCIAPSGAITIRAAGRELGFARAYAAAARAFFPCASIHGYVSAIPGLIGAWARQRSEQMRLLSQIAALYDRRAFDPFDVDPLLGDFGYDTFAARAFRTCSSTHGYVSAMPCLIGAGARQPCE